MCGPRGKTPQTLVWLEAYWKEVALDCKSHSNWILTRDEACRLSHLGDPSDKATWLHELYLLLLPFLVSSIGTCTVSITAQFQIQGDHTSKSLLNLAASMSAARRVLTIPLVLGLLAFHSAASVLHFDTPRGFQQRDTNDTLTDSLLSVVAAANDTDILTRDVSPTASYTNAISDNADALNNLFGQSTASGVAQTTRASLTCLAASLVFGSDVITSRSSMYATEQNEPWYVTTI